MSEYLYEVSLAQIEDAGVTLRCKIELRAANKVQAITRALDAVGRGKWETFPYRGERDAVRIL